MGKHSFMFYDNWGYLIDPISDAAAGKLLKAVLKYRETWEKETVSSEIAGAYNLMVSIIDIDEEKYKRKCEQYKVNGSKSKTQKSNNNDFGGLV